MLSCSVLLIFAVGCATKKPQRLAPVPPMPPVMRQAAETASQPQAAVIGPPPVKQFDLAWNHELPCEVYSSTNLQDWVLVSPDSIGSYRFFAAKPQEYFKVRAWNIEQYQVKSNGVWLTRTFTNYSNWATTE